MKTSMKINMMKFYKEIISVNTIKKLPLGGLGGHFFVLAIFFLISVALSAPESIAFCQ